MVLAADEDLQAQYTTAAAAAGQQVAFRADGVVAVGSAESVAAVLEALDAGPRKAGPIVDLLPALDGSHLSFVLGLSHA